MTSHGLPTADIIWTDEGAPRSVAFGDIYFAPADGMAETRHVFLDGIGAPDAWAGRRQFTLAETGFGTGLNFLMAWDLWRRTADAGARLTYVAVEAFPMLVADLERALAKFPPLAPLAEALADVWPPPIRGSHVRDFDGGRVRLILLFGDAAEMLVGQVGRVDGWFLDGFAPRKNSAMWSPELFQAVARLSSDDARLATFTVAGVVKRGLEGAGFEIWKRPGFGAKRECLAAHVRGERPPAPDHAPWFTPPAAPNPTPRHVAVVGAGIAGLMTAAALRNRGAEVTLYDKAPELVAEASGNPRAILEPWVDVGPGPIGQFSREATRFALDWYAAHGGAAFDPCGVMSPGGDRTWQERVAGGGHLADGDALLRPDGVFFPRGGMIDTARLARQLSDGVTLRLGQDIRDLDEIEADAVVIAASFGSERLAGMPLALNARRGQVSLVEGGLPVANVLSGKGYVTPEIATAAGPRHLVGATFAAADPDEDHWRALSAADHAANVLALAALVPGAQRSALAGRAGLRATMADHLPIMGAVPVPDFGDMYQGLRSGRRGPYPRVTYQPGRYMLTGLGARGYLTSPLLADALAAMILGEPLPLLRRLLDALHPGRGVIRAIRRTKGPS